jgi:hypothetical protein
MKKIILTLLSTTFLSLLALADMPRLTIEDAYFNLCDQAGRLLVPKILHLKPNDKVCVTVNGTDYKGLVSLREEIEKEYIKIIGQLFNDKNKDQVGFGFYIDMNGKFIGTIINQTTERQWGFSYDAPSKGYILIEEVKKKQNELL